MNPRNLLINTRCEMGWIASARHLAWQVGQGGVGGLVLGGDDQLLLYDGEFDQIMIEIMMIL